MGNAPASANAPADPTPTIAEALQGDLDRIESDGADPVVDGWNCAASGQREAAEACL